MAKRSARRAKSSASKSSGPTLAANATDRAKAIHGLMSLLGEHSWGEIGLADIAERGGLSLANLRTEFGSPLSILSGFVRDIDRLVLTDAKKDEDESPRDRLFEVLMRRFEVLTPYKDAIRSLARSARSNPPLALALNGMNVQSQQWMLTAAGIKANGPKGMIRAQGLALMYANVGRTWLDDDEADLARTMAALDRGLSNGQRWSGFLDDLCAIPEGLSRRRRRHRHRDEEAEAEAA
jgi:hypothetical protein